jgi:FkbM family methyltransferase
VSTMTMRSVAKRVARGFGLRVTRERPSNRFQAIDECLERMKKSGYEPAVVVDVGANHGQFHRLIQPLFPDARYHLIEPQPACASSLRRLTEMNDRVEYHALALTEPGIQSVRLLGGGASGGSTGAYVARSGECDPHEIVVQATTLDELLSKRIEHGQRALLKLDVESHELAVLFGSIASLAKIEVVLAEVRFFDVENRGTPGLLALVGFLEQHGFALYDIASLAGRPRDMRLRMGDLLFARKKSTLVADNSWK